MMMMMMMMTMMMMTFLLSSCRAKDSQVSTTVSYADANWEVVPGSNYTDLVRERSQESDDMMSNAKPTSQRTTQAGVPGSCGRPTQPTNVAYVATWKP